MSYGEAEAAAFDLRAGVSDTGPLLVDDYVPHPEEVCARDGDL